MIITGQLSWVQAEEYFEKGEPANLELARELLPYAKMLLISQWIGSTIYFAACFKWPRLIRYYLYVELLPQLIKIGIPQEISMSEDAMQS